MVDLREKRSYPRAKIEWPITIKTEQGSVQGLTLNVSAGGAQIRCKSPPLLYEVFEMTIKTPELDRSLVVDAQVVWSTADLLDSELTLPIIGVSFTHISDRDRWLISTAVSMFLKEKKRVPPRVEAAKKALEKALKECMEETPEE